jgi:hypothetical protein
MRLARVEQLEKSNTDEPRSEAVDRENVVKLLLSVGVELGNICVNVFRIRFGVFVVWTDLEAFVSAGFS